MPSPVTKPITGKNSDELSFVVRKKPLGSGFDYWNVETTGTWSGDCELGRKLGREFLSYIGKHPTNGNATLLGCIVAAMADNATVGRRAKGAEIGFMAEVNEYAMGLAVVVQQPNRIDDPDAPILAAYETWCAAYDGASASPDGDEVRLQDLNDAEMALVNLTPVTARGLAIQYVAFSSFGTMGTESSFYSLNDAIIALANVKSPATLLPRSQAEAA